MIVIEFDWFYVYQPRNIKAFTSYWSLEIHDFAHIPQTSSTPHSSKVIPKQKLLVEGYDMWGIFQWYVGDKTLILG